MAINFIVRKKKKTAWLPNWATFESPALVSFELTFFL